MRSFFDTLGKSEINPPAANRFLYPVFHYSTIPSFHPTTTGNLHPSGVKSKPDPLGPDYLLLIVRLVLI
jgi:hypothetical protein